MIEACRLMNRKMIKIGNVIKDIKDSQKDKWVSKYQKIARDFFNEDYEQVNKEPRDVLQELYEQNIKNNTISMDLYLIGIDARIRAGNPDKTLIDEGLRLADNDTAILLRCLEMKIQDFEINRLNDINIEVVLNDIISLGIETEEKIYEKFRDNKDRCMCFENRVYLEECYERFNHLYEKKELIQVLSKKVYLNAYKLENLYVKNKLRLISK
jgi:hypothetical protein